MDTIQFAKEIRRKTLFCVHSQGSGHVGGSLSIADALAVLYGEVLNIDPQNPNKDGRDRLVLSKGHAGPALYATLALKGYFPLDWLTTLNKLGTKLPSHCNMLLTPGVDMTAGSLGQGISAGIGLALGSKLNNDDAFVYCIVGDGELQEGQNWEAIMYAGAKKINNLVVIVDSNKLQIDGEVKDILDIENIEEKFASFGFATQRIDGHDHKALKQAFALAKTQEKASCIVMDTIKGKGVSFYETMGASVHSTTCDDTQYADALSQLED